MRVKVRLEHILNKAKKSQPEAMSHTGYDAMGGAVPVAILGEESTGP